MLLFMLITLISFAFAGTVLLHPAFHSDLAQFVRKQAGADVDRELVRNLVSGVSVVIPARNEAENLPALLDSLEAQTAVPREIIVVDDQSEDATATVAARSGTRVVRAGERPQGWLGKPWASLRGAREAGGQYLLFLDADVRLHPEALETLARALLALSPDWPRSVTTVSVQPYHRTVRYRERLALLFNIQVFVGASRRTRGLLLTMDGSCCFGPCILCGRKEYFSFGGHAGVRGSVLDDMDLGRRFVEAEVASRSFTGRGVIDFRMYPGGVHALLDGFTKNILLGARRSGGWFKALAVLWITGLLAAPLYAVTGAVTGQVPALVIAVVFYTFFAVQFAAAGRRVGNFGLLPALFYPVHLLMFLFVLARSAALALTGRTVQWKGRALHIDSGS